MKTKLFADALKKGDDANILKLAKDLFSLENMISIIERMKHLLECIPIEYTSVQFQMEEIIQKSAIDFIKNLVDLLQKEGVFIIYLDIPEYGNTRYILKFQWIQKTGWISYENRDYRLYINPDGSIFADIP